MESWKARVYAAYADTVARQTGRSTRGAETADRRDYVRRYRRLLPLDRSTPILDIGCGTGGFLDALHSLGYRSIEGIDVSQSQLDAAAARGVTGVRLASAVEYLRERHHR